jgi:hypothetical protein
MGDAQRATKAERFAEFLRRLGAAPSASDFDEAYNQLCDILNAVEDEMTSIPFDPANWQSDGRMYPPQMDNLKEVPGRPEVKRFRSLKHNTLIGDNGAIAIRELTGQTIFSKPGSDGRLIENGPSEDEEPKRFRDVGFPDDGPIESGPSEDKGP